MRVKTVSVSYGRKFNLGDYNSCSIDASVWADLDYKEILDENGQVVGVEQAENPVEVFDALFAMVKDEVRKQSMPVLRPNLNAILQQLQQVTVTQEDLKGILAKLIADGTLEIKLVQEESKQGAGEGENAIYENQEREK